MYTGFEFRVVDLFLDVRQLSSTKAGHVPCKFEVSCLLPFRWVSLRVYGLHAAGPGTVEYVYTVRNQGTTLVRLTWVYVWRALRVLENTLVVVYPV